MVSQPISWKPDKRAPSRRKRLNKSNSSWSIETIESMLPRSVMTRIDQLPHLGLRPAQKPQHLSQGPPVATSLRPEQVWHLENLAAQGESRWAQKYPKIVLMLTETKTPEINSPLEEADIRQMPTMALIIDRPPGLSSTKRRSSTRPWRREMMLWAKRAKNKWTTLKIA